MTAPLLLLPLPPGSGMAAFLSFCWALIGLAVLLAGERIVVLYKYRPGALCENTLNLRRCTRGFVR